MKKVLIMPALAAALLTAACGDDGGPTEPDETASVRFFNATTGMTGSGGFTANGQFAAGSALPFGQATQACSKVAAGSTSFGFGAANPGGTALSGNAIATLAGQNLPTNGNFTLVATGSATSPSLLLLDNDFQSIIGSQAAVRFVNLAPGTGATANTYTVLKGVLGQGHSLFKSNIEVGVPTDFGTMAAGSNPFTILQGHEVVISGSAATLNLQAGSVNTVAIVPTTSGGLQLVNIPRC